MWARGRVAIHECPKSYVTPESVAFLERFSIWKALGGRLETLSAREVDALVTIENEWRAETDHANQ